jgi:hypothetical protein
MLVDTGKMLETMDSHSLTVILDGDGDKVISLTDYEFLSSYNWVDDDNPVIYVPGRQLSLFGPAATLLIRTKGPLQFGNPTNLPSKLTRTKAHISLTRTPPAVPSTLPRLCFDPLP